MPGRDTGVSVIEHVLQSIPGCHIHHYESGSGRNSWVHIGEFAQRFLLMQEAIEDFPKFDLRSTISKLRYQTPKG